MNAFECQMIIVGTIWNGSLYVNVSSNNPIISNAFLISNDFQLLLLFMNHEFGISSLLNNNNPSKVAAHSVLNIL